MWNFDFDKLIIDYGTGTIVAYEENGTFYVNGAPILSFSHEGQNITGLTVLDTYFPFFGTSKYFYARYFLNRNIKGKVVSFSGDTFEIEEYDKILKIDTNYILEHNSMVVAEVIRKWFPDWTFSARGTKKLPRTLKQLMNTATAARTLHRVEQFRELDPLILKHQLIVYESDASKPLLIDLVNRVHVGTIEVKASNIRNAGNGLFALKVFKAGDLICDYGGVLTSNNTNDYLEENDKSRGAYSVEITESDDSKFKGWYVDSRRFFTINEPGRWANMRREPNGNNAELVSSIDFRGLPKVQLFAKRRINYQEEIYVDYGSEYYWEDQQAEGIVRNGDDVYADRDYKKGETVGIYAKTMHVGKPPTFDNRYQTLEYVYPFKKKGYFYPIDEPENMGRWIGIAADQNEYNVDKRLNVNVVEVFALKDIRAGDKLLFKSALAYKDKDDFPRQLQAVDRDVFLVRPYRRRD